MATEKTTKKDNLHKSNQESKSLTRQYIKMALLYLMKKTPFEKITVTAIINRAGVSRAGFYRNYSSKEDVLEDIAFAIYKRFTEYYLCELCDATPYVRYLSLFQRLQENAEWFQIVLTLNSHLKHIFNTAAYIEHYLSPQSPEEHYRYIAIANSQRAIIIDWFENGMKEAPEEMAEILSNIFNEERSFFQQFKNTAL